MRKIGLALISLSFLAGAYVSVLHETEVSWLYFLVFLAFGFVGVALARSGAKSEATHEDRLTSDVAVLRSSLASIVSGVSVLNAEKDSIPTYDMSGLIDERVLDHLNTFIEARESMKHVYGLQAYADVMSHYAGAERYLNRVWSASADGYVEEVKEYLTRSLEQFSLAREKLEASKPLA